MNFKVENFLRPNMKKLRDSDCNIETVFDVQIYYCKQHVRIVITTFYSLPVQYTNQNYIVQLSVFSDNCTKSRKLYGIGSK